MKPDLKHLKCTAGAIGTILLMPVGGLQAQQVPLAQTVAEVPVPASGPKTRAHHRIGAVKPDLYDNKRNGTVYFYTQNDSQLQQLVGELSYTVTFAKGQLPPVKGFWSLAMYNTGHLFYPNALKRYALGAKNKKLKYNDDGSLTIYLGNKSPGKETESNWLPAPPGNFSIWLRAYWPDQAILDGTWKPPVIVIAK